MTLKANTAENGKLMYEAGKTSYAMEALSDSGDNTTFTSNATYWSDDSGYSPDVRPDGVISGCVISEDDAAVNDTVDITLGTCYLAGVETSVTAASVAITRSVNGGTPYIINSIIVTALGVYDKIAGTEGAAYSAVRGAAGGPPLVTVGTIEIGWVKTSSITNAAIDESEIFQIPGTSLERYDYPLWEENFLPNEDGSIAGGSITFLAALPDHHTGTIPKAVYASYADPIFAEMRPVSGFVPPENSHSVTSTQVYGGTIGSRSSSIGQGSFTSYLKDGVNDPAIKLKDHILCFKFYPDRYKSGYVLCQGKLGTSTTYPPDGPMSAACTISADVVSRPKSS